MNAVTHTAVDKAKTDPEPAFAINASGPAILAEEARVLGLRMIHYSTDLRLRRLKEDAMVEWETRNPLNIYGESKLAGEVVQTGGRRSHRAFRTSWVYGATGKKLRAVDPEVCTGT